MEKQNVDEDVRRYLDAVPDARKAHIDTLHSAIMEYFPESMVNMKYKMPTYCYGKGWVALANQKNYVSLYTCSADHLEEFRKKYPHYKTGKGCINFREKDEIPVDAVKAVIRHAILHPKGR